MGLKGFGTLFWNGDFLQEKGGENVTGGKCPQGREGRGGGSLNNQGGKLYMLG